MRTLRLRTLLSQLTNSNQTLSITKQLHALTTTVNLIHDPFYATNLVRLYSKNDDVVSARKLFDKTPHRTIFLWNSIIRAFAKTLKLNDAFYMFKLMDCGEIFPDSRTYACLSRACYESGNVESLKVLHGRIVSCGLGLDSICCSALVTGYSKLGFVGEARKVFDGVVELDLVMWNCMVSGYCCCGLWSEGLQVFGDMRRGGKEKIDGYSLVGLISGLEESGLVSIGEGIHCLCLKSGFGSNCHVGCALVSMYSRYGCMNSAYGVFSGISEPDLVTWSSLINGYSHFGDYEKALSLYRILNEKGKMADPVLIAGGLVAVGQSANVCPGTEIHGYTIRHGFELNVIVSSALIDMYSKCGFMNVGIRVFQHMKIRNIVCYNTIILGLGLNGLASQALGMFEALLAEGLKPDESTFSALLSACSHAGLVEDGWEIFWRMTDEYCIQARTEHYVHIVKLFGMAGELNEAYKFILSLKQPVDSGIWGALLSCCNWYRNTELAEIVEQQLLDNEPEKGAYRVMLSNLYASSERWDDVKKLREDTKINQAWKMPGLSWIGCSYS